MIRHNQKRYAHDNLDFIIPFLINQSTESSTQQETPLKKKRASVPSRVKEHNNDSSMEIVKIYRANKKERSPDKSEQKLRLEKLKKQKEKQPCDKGHSQLQLTLNKSPYVVRNRFFKAQSVVNHLPSHNFLEEVLEFKHSPERLTEESPIPGIRFKKRSMFNESANLLTPQLNFEDLSEYKSEFTGKIKFWRQKKQWNKKRCANVDFIINRKCKNFNDLISEYRRRLSIENNSQIFIFNSKDLWLKRILFDRGWIENLNKQSKAFHLYWSSKVYKERVFPEQLTNHYQSSDLLTSKAGLHKMLVKYGLTYLQPKTFDLSVQRTQFTLYFIKLEFISKLKSIISKFEFEDEPLHSSYEQIRQHFIKLKAKGEEEKLDKESSIFEGDLVSLISNCFNLLENKIEKINTTFLDHILNSIHSTLTLTPLEEEYVRILRDFEFLSRRFKLYQTDVEIGSHNIWLTKSKNSSKGVGISLHKDYDSIMKYQNRLAQKYVQNPLIFKDSMIKGRKFDIRIWVLLVGSAKASLFYHQKFYGRLCYESYSLQTISLDNQKKHLTNYSQNKLKFKDESLADSILLPEQIFELVLREKGLNFKENFYQKVEEMLNKLAVIFRQEIAQGSQNSFELFGLDLLIDDNLNLHLLQINLSAACEERHESLTDMLQDVGHGMLNILQGDANVRGWKLIK